MNKFNSTVEINVLENFLRDDLNKLNSQVGRCFEISRRYLSFLHSQSAEKAQVGVNQIMSDLKELLALCDRIAVMSAGKLVTEFRRGEWTEDRIKSAAFSELTKTAAVSAEPIETSNGEASIRPSQPIP